MSSLPTELDEYLAVRRALGYQLRLTGRLLKRFVEFAEHAHADYMKIKEKVRQGSRME